MAGRAAATPPFLFEIASSLALLAMTKGGVPRNDRKGVCHCEPLSLPLRRQGVAIPGKSKLKNQKAKRQSKNKKNKKLKFLELNVTNGK